MNFQLVEGIWVETGASPEYLAAMRLILPGEQVRGDPGQDPARWALLPGLCCQAAGGNPGWAEDISTGWSLLYEAAHLLDAIQDRDTFDPRLQELGAAAAINVASGLVISGLALVNQLHKRRGFSPVAGEICTRFYNVGIRMSGGQHLDLVTERPGLEEWFEIAEDKSGSFFGLACWAGARLASGEAERLDGFSRFGSHLGVLLQIHDDLADLGDLKDGKMKEPLQWITRCLPVTYALEVCPEETRKRLIYSLKNARQEQEVRRELFDLLDHSGTGLYLKVEIERRQALARDALESARPDPSVQDTLLSFVSIFDKDTQPG